MDLFISMLDVGLIGYKSLLKERKENFEILKSEISKWAESKNEKIIMNQRNRISLAVTLKNIGPDLAGELGAWLYRKGVMGARVVSQSQAKQKEKVEIVNWTNTKKFGENLEKNKKEEKTEINRN